MDIRRSIAAIAILFLFTSCKGYKRIVEETHEQITKEKVESIEPFKLSTVKEVEVDEFGQLVPFDLSLDYDGLFDAVVKVANGEAELVLRNKDTLEMRTTIVHQTNKDIHPVEYREYEMSPRLKRFVWISAGFNLLCAIILIVRVWRKLVLPL